ncbi:zinc finger domain-containing protein [Streptomyces halstedii]|uniref:zinc finger domain-containing protein n=1 Tax=Streptomyces halstedii TaxID=1944 RepID=UPI00365EC8C0
MTAALDRTRALLDQPPPEPIPGQLDLTRSHDMPERPAHLPALAVACPTCGSVPGELCTSHSGTRTRRNDVHQARTAAYRKRPTP